MRYIFFILLALAGCTTANSGNYAANLRGWVGQNELSLYEGWGTPDSTLYLTPQEKVVTYAKTFAKPIDGQTEPYSNEVYYPAITTDNYGYPSNGTAALLLPSSTARSVPTALTAMTASAAGKNHDTVSPAGNRRLRPLPTVL